MINTGELGSAGSAIGKEERLSILKCWAGNKMSNGVGSFKKRKTAENQWKAAFYNGGVY